MVLLRIIFGTGRPKTLTYDSNSGSLFNGDLEFVRLSPGLTFELDSFNFLNADFSNADRSEVTLDIPFFNTAPNIETDNTATVEENQTFAIDVNATDDLNDEGEGLVYSLSGTDAELFNIDEFGVVNFNDAPDFETPGDADGDNNYQLQVTVADSEGLSASQDLTISVSDVDENNPPTAVDDSATTAFNTPVEIAVLNNDSDPDGDLLSVEDFTNPNSGSVSINGDALIYTPNDGFSGSDSFSYTISDGNGGTASAEVLLEVGTDVDAGNGQDDVEGNAGNDNLIGGNGSDFLEGGLGNDTLDGRRGNDTLYGGEGDDILTGGRGDDTFVLAAGEGTDTITDFGNKGNDVIGLSGGISYNDLTFSGSDIILGGETLATLSGVDATNLSEGDFTSV